MSKAISPLRCRKWHRTRALVRPPPPANLEAAKKNVYAEVITKKLLELRSHGASLAVLAGKLSDQLLETRATLTAAELKVSQIEGLEKLKGNALEPDAWKGNDGAPKDTPPPHWLPHSQHNPFVDEEDEEKIRDAHGPTPKLQASPVEDSSKRIISP